MGLQQRLCDGLHFPPAEQPTYTQQTHVYCLEAQKVLIKGRIRFRNYSIKKVTVPELSHVLEGNSHRRPLEMQRVKSDGRL